MAIDYGSVRTGIAVTDDLQIVASSLDTVSTKRLLCFLSEYFSVNEVNDLVVGLPLDLKGNPCEIEDEIQIFIVQFADMFPEVKIHRLDERFTSKMASFFISQSGKSKKKREQKSLIDKVSATIILQNFLETRILVKK